MVRKRGRRPVVEPRHAGAGWGIRPRSLCHGGRDVTRLVLQIDPETRLELFGGWNSQDGSHVAVKLFRGKDEFHVRVDEGAARELGHYLIGLTSPGSG